MTTQKAATQPVSPGAGVTVLSAEADPVAFEHVITDLGFSEIETHPQYGAFGRRYHPAIHGNRDASFVVYAHNAPALVCLCAPLNGVLGFYDLPLKVVLYKALSDGAKPTSLDLAFQNLELIIARQGLKEVCILDQSGSVTSPIGERCRARSGTSSRRSIACVDLLAGPTAWRAALRKSSRSLINWGKRNLSISYVNRQSPNRALFDEYQAFHAEIAGRTTRSEASWNAMFEWIVQGGGELVMARLAERLVAGSMFVDGTEICIYASGVYDRTQFDKPLAHYPVWLGIERAQMRGMKLLELGAIPERDAVSDKEYQIGYFKRGFATELNTDLVWNWRQR
jgi:hypothetical protein